MLHTLNIKATILKEEGRVWGGGVLELQSNPLAEQTCSWEKKILNPSRRYDVP